MSAKKSSVFDVGLTSANGNRKLRESLNNWVQTIPGWCKQAIIFLASFLILVSQRPDAIFRPQFFIEDGPVFYTQAYSAGLLRPLFYTYAGYLHTFPRLVADLAQFFPLAYAPLIFNLLALTLQIFPVQLLLSSRLTAIGSLRARLFLSLLYLCLPNSFAIHANLASSHWRLAILAFLVIVSTPPRSKAAKLFDCSEVLMSGLTGPFAIMLTPIAFLYWRKSRENWKLLLTSILAACAAVQGTLILMAGQSDRIKEPQGANLPLLIEIMANHVFMGALIGRNILFHGHPLGALVVTSLGIVTLLYGIFRGPLQLRLFILFASLVLASSLASPMMPSPVVSGIPAGPHLAGWQALALGWAQRYWYMPMLAFVATLFWLLKPTAPAVLHLGAILCIVLMSFGVVRNWPFPPMEDLQFSEYAEKFRQAPRGTVMVIPLNPQGWSMQLVKH